MVMGTLACSGVCLGREAETASRFAWTVGSGILTVESLTDQLGAKACL